MTDVSPDSNEPSNITLRALLRLTTTTTYQIQNGDNLDFIIRKSFLVSATQKNAYNLYLNRVLALNPQITSNTVLKAGSTLTLPSGPKFGATELSQVKFARDWSQKVENASRKAYFSSQRERTANESELKQKAVRSLGHFVVADRPTLNATSSDELFSKIVGRGLIPAINRTSHPESSLLQVQPLKLTVSSDAAATAFTQLKAANKPAAILPARNSAASRGLMVQQYTGVER